MGYVISIVMGYLLGCSNMAVYIAKLKNIDLRGKGSGNPGTSNAVIVMGWGAGLSVAIHDIGKGILTVLLARLLFPGLYGIGEVAGISCVLGHIFPFYLKFKGGKGFASYVGMTLALNWKFALIVIVAVAAVTLITDYLVLGTFTAVVAVPVYVGIVNHSWVLAVILLVGTAVICVRHRENIIRIVKGTEIGLRSSLRGEHRVKQ